MADVENVIRAFTLSQTSDDCETLFSLILLLFALLENRGNRNYVVAFVENIIPSYTPDEFRGHFRMTRITVQHVYEALSEIINVNQLTGLTDRHYGGGKPQVHLQTKLLVFLWYMANKECYREISNLFSISMGACCSFVHKLAATFSKYLVPKVIKWPTQDEKVEISWTIEQTKGFPGVIGMIDGCHIPIKQPMEGGALYYNRKDFHSVILQAVCREDLRFTDIFIGFPGRVHDARVFDSSPLFLHGVPMCGEYLLLGDSAYPNLGWLLTPFRENMRLTQNMTRYNFVHSSIRSAIERSFALMKGRFRRLKYLDQSTVEIMCHTVASACCLHNICLLQEDAGDYFDEDVGVPVAILPPGIFNNDGRERGIMKRNQIMNRLARR